MILPIAAGVNRNLTDQEIQGVAATGGIIGLGYWDGAVTTRFDTGGLVHITQALIEAGFTEGEIRAVMGLNALRIIKAGLVPLKDLPKQNVEQKTETGQ